LTKQLIGAGAADQRVVAGPSKDVDSRQRATAFIERQVVIASQTKDLDQRGVRHGSVATGNRNSAAVDKEISGSISAYSDGIIKRIAKHGQNRCAGSKEGSYRGREPSAKVFYRGDSSVSATLTRPS
jgi:hypothetical protein